MAPRELREDLLSDAVAAEAADHGGTLRLIAATGARIRRAAALRELDPEADRVLGRLAEDGRPRALIILGHGTATTVARLVSAIGTSTAAVPIVAVAGPTLPGWVGPLDLVVVASTSGRSPEICVALTEAGRRGCRVVVVAPPASPIGLLSHQVRGSLIAMDDDSAPVWTRLWSVAVPVLIAAQTVGALPAQPFDAAASAADEAAVRARPSQEPFVNPAKEIALRLGDSTSAAVWASGPAAAVAAERLADQVALRTGQLVVHAALPDLGRGQLGLLDGPLAGTAGTDLFHDPFEDGATAQGAAVVLFTEDGADPRVSVVEDLVRDHGVPITSIAAAQTSGLERAAYLIALADFAAAYLAILLDTGPDQGHTIDQYRIRTAQ
jgi:glucose/mannose-6-phosphate isomerase